MPFANKLEPERGRRGSLGDDVPKFAPLGDHMAVACPLGRMPLAKFTLLVVDTVVVDPLERAVSLTRFSLLVGSEVVDDGLERVVLLGVAWSGLLDDLMTPICVSLSGTSPSPDIMSFFTEMLLSISLLSLFLAAGTEPLGNFLS